jgi:hypothetical protein
MYLGADIIDRKQDTMVVGVEELLCLDIEHQKLMSLEEKLTNPTTGPNNRIFSAAKEPGAKAEQQTGPEHHNGKHSTNTVGPVLLELA